MSVYGPTSGFNTLRLYLECSADDIPNETLSCSQTLSATIPLDECLDLDYYRDCLNDGEIGFSDIPYPWMKEQLSYDLIRKAILARDLDQLNGLIKSGALLDAYQEGEGFAWQACLDWRETSADCIEKLIQILEQSGINYETTKSDSKHDHLFFRIIKKVIKDSAFHLTQSLVLKKFIKVTPININVLDNNGDTPLHYLFSQQELFRIQKTSFQENPFLSLAGFFMSHGAKIDCKNHLGQYPLHKLMAGYPQEGSVEVIKAMKLSWLDVNKEDSFKKTPLSYSISLMTKDPLAIQRRFEQIDFLFSLGVNLNVYTNNENCLIHAFVHYDQYGRLTKYFPYFENPNVSDKKKNRSVLSALIKKLDDINTKPIVDCISALLDNLKKRNLCKLDSHDFDGYTPLHWAVIMGSVDVAGLLIKNGADLALKSSKDESSLDLASFRSNKIFKFILDLFIEQKLDEQIRTSKALFELVRVQDLPSIEIFMQAGANIHLKDDKGKTALDYAKEKMDVSSARRMITTQDPWLFFLSFISNNPLEKVFKLGNVNEDGYVKLETAINYMFLNSYLEDIQFFLKGFRSSIKNHPNNDEILKRLAKICGGFFTWGTLIARYPCREKQMSIVKAYIGPYGEKQESLEDRFVHQQTEMGYGVFTAVLDALKNPTEDFFKTYNFLAQQVSAVYKKRAHEAAAQFETWRYQTNRTDLIHTPQPADIYTAMGMMRLETMGRYPTFIEKARQVFEQSIEGIRKESDNFASAYRIAIQTESKHIPLTIVCFKNYLKPKEDSKLLRNYIWYHPRPQKSEILDLISKDFSLLIKNWSKDLLIKIIYKLFHTAPLLRGSAQASHCLLVYLQLLHGQQCYPVASKIGQLDCQVITTPEKEVIQEFDSYFDRGIKLKLPSFKNLSSIKAQINLIEENLGRQFLGLN